MLTRSFYLYLWLQTDLMELLRIIFGNNKETLDTCHYIQAIIAYNTNSMDYYFFFLFS